MGNLLSGPRGHNDPKHNAQMDADAARSKVDAMYVQVKALSQQSQDAHRRGDGRQAKVLSEQSKALRKQAEKQSQAAADAQFRAHNGEKRSDGMIDLHGLYTAEAAQVAERELEKAKARGEKQVVFIVGRGLHSADGVVKLRPAIEVLIKKHGLRCTSDRPHVGCLTAEFVQEAERGWFGPFGGCAIM